MTADAPVQQTRRRAEAHAPTTKGCESRDTNNASGAGPALVATPASVGPRSGDRIETWSYPLACDPRRRRNRRLRNTHSSLPCARDVAEDSFEIAVPLLAEGDQLFVSQDETRWATACLNFGNPEHGYIQGYRKAAVLAVEHIVTNDRDQDYLAYPIVFNYRQFLELFLKDLVARTADLLGRPLPNDKLMHGHQLPPVWAALAPLLEDVFGPDPQIGLISSCIAEFHSIDRVSETFRYVTKRDGTPTLPGELRWISLTRVLRQEDPSPSCLLGHTHGLVRAWKHFGSFPWAS
jgi:hypothetical protein